MISAVLWKYAYTLRHKKVFTHYSGLGGIGGVLKSKDDFWRWWGYGPRTGGAKAALEYLPHVRTTDT